MHESSQHRRPSGFTLIELLTVVAIIGILAAIIVPVVGKVRNTTRKSQSMNNLRQIGTAVQLYAAENRGYVPVWHDYSAVIPDPIYEGNIYGTYWWEQIQSYTGKDEDIFHSPEHDEFDKSTREKLRENISYGWNYLVVGRHIADSTSTGDHRMKINELPSPPQTLMAAEGRKLSSWGYITPQAPPDAGRYGSEIPALFADGHVSTIPHEELLVTDPWFTQIKAIPPKKPQP